LSRDRAPRRIRRLLGLLDAELGVQDVVGELSMVGGAAMCLVHDAREATRGFALEELLGA